MADETQFSKKAISSDAFKFHFKFWCFLGVYPMAYCGFLYVVILVLCVSLPVGLTIFLFKIDRARDILTNLSVNVTLVACFLKFANILIRRQEIVDFNIWINHLDKRAGSTQEQECLRSAVCTAHRIFYVICSLFLTVIWLAELVTLVAKENRLICPLWYPFDWQNSMVYYTIANIHQFVVLLINIFQNMTSDTFPAIHMLVLTSHVKALNIRIRNVGANSNKSCEQNVQDLIQCIRDRQLLMQYVHTVQKVTSAGIFLQFFATGIESCIIAVCVFFVKGDLFETMYLGFYFICVILEIFLYCYYGNELICESQRMTEAIYSCNWIGQDKAFQKILLMFMQSTQTTMTIMAGGYFAVSLQTFVTVMKSSYSLFAVLMRVT